MGELTHSFLVFFYYLFILNVQIKFESSFLFLLFLLLYLLLFLYIYLFFLLFNHLLFNIYY